MTVEVKTNYDYFRALMRTDLKKKRDEKALKDYAELKESSFNSGYEDRRDK